MEDQRCMSMLYQFARNANSRASLYNNCHQKGRTSSLWKALQRHASEFVSSAGRGSVDSTDSGFLAGWTHWHSCSPHRPEGCPGVETMASDDLEDSELVSVAEETPLGKETISLGVGEGYITEISLSFSILRRSTLDPNVSLQEAARKTLWALENDNKEMLLLFKELSARLVSIQAQNDVFIVTFKTIEEIWKFTTYLSLGIVACTLEHLLFDEIYWLNAALVEDTEIQVSVNQDELATLYLGLLLQEGCFYARAVVHDAGAQVEEEKEFLAVSVNDVVYVKDVGDESSWEGQSLSTGERGLLPIIAVEPLPHPFYQWFLKTYPTICNMTEQNCRNITSQPIGLGQCTARENHSATEWDELSYCRGDAIEVVGFFVPGLKWFVGKCPSTGATGFVQTKHVDPNCLKPLGKDLLFLSEDEKISLNSFDEDVQKGPMELLSSLAQTDISSVYRLDGLDPVEIYLKSPTGQLSVIEELSKFYSEVSPTIGAHITYCEHWVHLLQLLKDRQKEGDVLTTLSRLYQTLNTAKSLRKALDYTKQSLRISIDLGQHEKSAQRWIQAGKLYYLLQEDELVEIYLHAGIQASLKAEHFTATLHLYEAAGDVFFHGLQTREKALPFYKEGALPLAKKLEDTRSQLQIFHKLTQLLVNQGDYKSSLEFATMAVRLSTLVEDPVHELVAFHRLAGIYYALQIYEIAEYCYLKALSVCSSPIQHAAEAGYYVKVYWRLGDIALHRRKDAEDAVAYLSLALAAAIEVGNQEFQLLLLGKLSDVYSKFLCDEEQADIFIKQILQLGNNQTCT
ncbi:SH3 domain and tetratricopeptide repeat-containing protein 2 isoform X5 [Eleutherodactylus coqui]|uniref:SH3 domain and tetratricopeptide repeat-containing protein 2 isoform X5 n=1 Tax=Eleutherodactylus coqui TaxID=57060 RepID=UPI0034636C61